MTVEEIAQLYLAFISGNETLNDAFRKKFGTALDEASVNQNVKMDDGTERIIHFLRETYRVDINILFFRVFQHGSELVISWTWFEEDIEEAFPAEVKQKGLGTGNTMSFGEGSRNWEDTRTHGFISAGGSSWCSKTLSLLFPGDRVWVNIPHTGYVGVGIVTEPVQQARVPSSRWRVKK